jgi:hypothetical protein
MGGSGIASHIARGGPQFALRARLVNHAALAVLAFAFVTSMFPRVLALIGLAGIAPIMLAAGCGDAPTPASDTGTPTQIRPFAPDASDAASAPNASNAGHPDGASLQPAVVSATTGSSLCHYSSTVFPPDCYPDDLVNACDLGIGSGGDGGGPGGAACHVVEGSFGAHPTCLPAGFGLNNSTCAAPTDCAVGHECVGAGTCHQYCCGGNTECSVNEFCDVQSTTQDPDLVVPVCMPEIPCVLLDNDSCPSGQQCSVVKDDGSTSCVLVGPQTEGQLCEDAHCERGLLCLGPEGARRCATLCYTASPTACKTEHGTTKTCAGALPLFLSPTVGVCQ